MTIDHLVSTTILVAVILIFVGLANQTLQSAIIYQRHANLATKCSSLLDSILLSSGVPSYWGTNDPAPTMFGLQDPESLRNELGSFSLMRLRSGAEPVYYSKTDSYYSNMTIGSGDSLLELLAETVSYTTVSELLGTNGTYGFQLTLTPTITVSISEVQESNSSNLRFSVNAQGTGSPLSNGTVNYCLIIIDVQGDYPCYSLNCGTASLDNLGSALLNFSGIDGSSRSFALLAYAYLPGLVGMGYYKQVTDHENSVIPLVFDVEDGEVILAHSFDIDRRSDATPLAYHGAFVSVSEDLAFTDNPLQNSTGMVGGENPPRILTISKDTSGILVAAYKKSDGTTGVTLMPWGIGPLSFPISFGESPTGKEWVSTDMRQVIVDNVGYQVVLSMWSLEGYEMIGQ